jgi:hypothetical protein
MPELRWDVLICISLLTSMILCVGWGFLENVMQRMFFVMNTIGLYLWSGIGAAYDSVPDRYRWSYVIFALLVPCAFFGTLWRSKPLGQLFHRQTGERVAAIVGSRRFTAVAIAAHLAANLMLLLYPEVKVQTLVAPPAPDLSASVEANYSLEADDPITKLIGYAVLLSGPFYLAALFNFRDRPGLLALLLAIPAYITYCSIAYIARGAILSAMILYGFALWLSNPRWRLYLLASSLVVVPLMVIAFYEYTYLRLGADASNTSWSESLEGLFESETTFPLAAETIIEGNYRANPTEYLTWLATLPIPKVITGPIAGTRINDEISWILMRRDVVHGGFILLPGLVTESIFLFGEWFFWLHAVFIGVLMALMCRMFERHKTLLLVSLALALTFSYDLSRGGIGAAMPMLVNRHLAIVLWLGCLCYQPLSLRRFSTPTNAHLASMVRRRTRNQLPWETATRN